MKIWNLYVSWITPHQREMITTAVSNVLRKDPDARALVAKMARSEVKNYLAELAEQNEMPFQMKASEEE